MFYLADRVRTTICCWACKKHVGGGWLVTLPEDVREGGAVTVTMCGSCEEELLTHLERRFESRHQA